MTAMFQSYARQQLHADTDTEKGDRAVSHSPREGLDHAVERRQPPVTIRKGALPRQDDPVRPGDRVRVGGYNDRFAREFLETLRCRAQITRSVINNRECHLKANRRERPWSTELRRPFADR